MHLLRDERERRQAAGVTATHRAEANPSGAPRDLEPERSLRRGSPPGACIDACGSPCVASLAMPRVLLVRHGHVEGIDPPRFRGRRDLPLDEEGHRQARAVAVHIAAHWQPNALYTSPLRRCAQTAAEIAGACSLAPLALADLVDLDYGSWEWKTHEEVRAQWPQLCESWFATPQLVRFPEGESLAHLIARTANVLQRVLEHHSSDTLVLVGHDSGIRALLMQLLDQPISAYWRLAPEPASVSEAQIVPGEVRVLRINETGHLPK